MVNMRLFRRKRESDSSTGSTAIVVIGVAEDELLVEELQAEPRRMERLAPELLSSQDSPRPDLSVRVREV